MIEQQIAAALLAAGDLLSLDDLRELAIARRVQWWGVNAFPALKDGDFCNQRVAFHPEQ